MHLPSGCFDDLQATPHKLQDPSWTPGEWSVKRVCSESQHENFKMFNETMEKISQGKFQPLKAPLTKRWEVATSNEKENCLKTAEMSCRLVCGVIAPNDPDKLYEALLTATEKQSSNNSIQECTDKESKNSNSQPVCSELLDWRAKETSRAFREAKWSADKESETSSEDKWSRSAIKESD